MRQIILARNSSPAVSLYLRHINGANSNVPERGIQWPVGTTRGSDLGRRLAPFFVRHNDHAIVSGRRGRFSIVPQHRPERAGMVRR